MENLLVPHWVVGKITKTLGPPRRLMRGLGISGVYALWLLTCRILVLTLITYLLIPSSSRLQDISEAFSSSEILVSAVSALSFVMLLIWLKPIAGPQVGELFHPVRFRRFFAPAFLQGMGLGAGLTLLFILTGYYSVIGFFLHSESTLVAFLTAAARTIAIFVLVYSEEYLFRNKLMRYFGDRIPRIHPVLLLSILYCLFKVIQFDLGIRQMATLFLISVLLGLRAAAERDFTAGAGYWTGLLAVFHAVLGLPIFGNHFSGIVMISYQGSALEPTGLLSALSQSVDSQTAFFITGGLGGPLSSVALQVLLLIQILITLFRHKKLLLHPPPESLR